MSSFTSLEVGKRALAAQRLGLDVTGNNIANVNTPNYSRRVANLSETDPKLTTNGFIGTGVLVDTLRTFREEFFDKEIRKNIARKAAYENEEKAIRKIEAILGEPSENGLSELMTDFFNSFENLSVKPDDIGLRSNVLAKAEAVVERFHTISSQLTEMRKQTISELNQSVSDINKLLNEIADLNVKIVSAKAQTGSEVQSLIDKRVEKLENLSAIVGINTTTSELGSVNVFINGINVVTGNIAERLRLVEYVNPFSGEQTLRLATVDQNDVIKNYVSPQEGAVYSNLKIYNVLLDDLETSNSFSIAKQLDELASAIVQKFNAVSVTGWGLDDNDLLPPGRNFFEPALGTVKASNIRLSDDIKNKPRNIPTSDAPAEPGNNNICLKFARLSTDSTFIDSKTAIDYYATFLASIGSIGSEVTNGRKTTSLISQQLTSQREAVIGVNLDEEAVNLIKFQKAFEASSRVINMTNEILSTIVNLGR